MLNPEATDGADPAPYLRNTDVQWGMVNTTDLPRMSFDARERAKFSLRRGDLLVCEGGDVGRSAIWHGDLAECYYQKAVHRVRPLRDSEDPRFLYYVMRAASWRGEFLADGNKSTIAHLPAEKLRATRAPFPPAREQRLIADFLDQKTSAIDALVEKKERQKSLVEEEWLAAITQATTRGLDLRVHAVEVPHLSTPIPSHWAVHRVKYLVTYVTSGSRGWAEYYAEVGALFLRIGNLRRGHLAFDLCDKQYVSPPGGAEGRRTQVRNGDVLTSITAFIGSVAVVHELGVDAFVSQHVALMRPDLSRVRPKWLGYALLSQVGQHQLLAAMYGGTKVQLGLDDVRNAWLPIPPLKEQDAIAAWLDELERRLLEVSRRLERQIECLREYRQTLITAAVTGQLDVTKEAA